MQSFHHRGPSSSHRKRFTERVIYGKLFDTRLSDVLGVEEEEEERQGSSVDFKFYFGRRVSWRASRDRRVMVPSGNGSSNFVRTTLYPYLSIRTTLYPYLFTRRKQAIRPPPRLPPLHEGHTATLHRPAHFSRRRAFKRRLRSSARQRPEHADQPHGTGVKPRCTLLFRTSSRTDSWTLNYRPRQGSRGCERDPAAPQG